MSDNKMAKTFWMVGDITHDVSAHFVNYIYNCAAEDKTAVVVLASFGGEIPSIANMIQTLKVTGVRMVIVGYGKIRGGASAIFCQGDERYLSPGTDLQINSINPNFDKFYLEKTEISDEIFASEVMDEGFWKVQYEDFEELVIVTGTYAQAVKMLVENCVNNPSAKKFETPFFLKGKMTLESTRGILDYILRCAAFGLEAFVEIESEGGDISCLEVILSTLELTKIKLTTIGGGIVESAAAALFLLGDRRAMKDDTTFIIHEARNDCSKLDLLVEAELEKMLKGLRKATEVLTFCYLKNTTLSKEELNRRIKGGRDWFVVDDEFSFTTHEYEEIVKEIINCRKKS